MSATERLIAAVERWCSGREDVRAALVVGSQARSDAPADRWSDVDVVLLVDNPGRYVTDATWAAELGEVVLTYVEPAAVGGSLERRILLADGLEVDVALLPAAVLTGGISPEELGVLARGVRILHDPEGAVAALAGQAGDPPAPSLSQARFDQLLSDALHHLLWASRKLARDELLPARRALECHVAGILVELATWQARLAGRSPWHAGRFLAAWADPVALVALLHDEPLGRADGIARAIELNAQVLGTLGRDVAGRAGLAYPERAERAVLDLVEEALAAVRRPT